MKSTSANGIAYPMYKWITQLVLTASVLMLLIISHQAQAVSIPLDGTEALISGTDCEVGATYRFGTTASYGGKNIDLLVSITGDDNDYMTSLESCVGITVNPDNASQSLLSFFGESLDGSNNNVSDPWSTDINMKFVEKNTTTPIVLDRLLFSVFDQDSTPIVATDDVYLHNPGAVYLDTSTFVTASTIAFAGPNSITYTRKLTGRPDDDCLGTDVRCQGSAIWIAPSEVNFRIANDDGDGTRIITLTFERNDFENLNLGNDFGDAAVSYGSTTDPIDANILLGPGLPADRETAAQTSIDALGDDTDSASTDFNDDDGVFLNGSRLQNQAIPLNSTSNLNVMAFSPSKLNAWFDWNDNGDFSDPGEQVVTDSILAKGNNTVSITVPGGTAANTTMARFRICGATDLCNTLAAVATAGETEDYSITLTGILLSQNESITVQESSVDSPLGLTAISSGSEVGLTITVSGLPTLGVIQKADGTPVTNAQILTSAELYTLIYDAPTHYVPGSNPGVFTYSVSDGSFDVTGTVDITVIPDLDDDNDGIPDVIEGDRSVDTDNDSIPDSLDLDSDNDGLPDLVESGADYAFLDTDGDGRIDSGFGNNGLADAVETIAESGLSDYNNDGALDAPRDTDGDGVPDFRDLDSDDDSLNDIIETLGVDTNGDAQVDTPTDVNGDGWQDSFNSTSLTIPDTDNDSLPDYRDLDSDNDALTDINENGNSSLDADNDGRVDGPDTENDGIKDSVDLIPAIFGDAELTPPVDLNTNGIPDFKEAGRILTGLDGHGGGSWNPYLLGIIALLGLVRRNLNLSIPLLVAASLLMSLTAEANDFNRRIYMGASALTSVVEPDTNTTGYKVSSDSSAGYSLHLGADISEHWSVETYYADLGEAGISRKSDNAKAGDITYDHLGISAIGYFFNQRDESEYGTGYENEGLARREGLTPYGRIGVGKMNNSTDLPYKRTNDVHLHIGGGLEYGWDNGLAARAEVISHDTDALSMSVGLVKRFGGEEQPYKPIPYSPATPVAVERVQLASTPVLPSVPVAAPITAPKMPAAAKRIKIRLPFLFFDNDKSVLSLQARKKLDYLARVMKKHPSLRLSVHGHTDANAEDNYNLNLSFRRAATAKRYLTSAGIASSRLSTVAEGESKPLLSNKQEKGRAKNRRVEFHILKPHTQRK